MAPLCGWKGRGETGSVCEGAFFCVPGAGDLLAVHFLSALCGTLFLHRDYFGTSDELVLTFVLAALLLVLGEKAGGGNRRLKAERRHWKDFSGDNDSDRRNFYSDCHEYWDFSYRMSGICCPAGSFWSCCCCCPPTDTGDCDFGGLLRGTREENGGRTFCARWEAYARRSSGQRREITAARFFTDSSESFFRQLPDGAGDAFFCRPCAGDERGDTESSADTGGVCPYPLIFITF